MKQPTQRRRFEDPLQVLPRALTKLYSIWVSRTYPFASIGRDVSIHFTAKISRRRAPRISVGSSVGVGKDVWLNIIPEATDELNIVIGDDCRVGARTCISAKKQIHLQRDVHLGPSVLIQDHSHAYDNPDLPINRQIATPGGSIRIERGCRIGQGVAIVCAQGELVLGEHCVVRPNSVVIRSAPPYSVLGGNPARVIERRDPPQANQEPLASSAGRAVSEANALEQ